MWCALIEQAVRDYRRRPARQRCAKVGEQHRSRRYTARQFFASEHFETLADHLGLDAGAIRKVLKHAD
jgi:hypothetical protein